MLGELFAIMNAICLAIAATFYAIGVRNTDPYRANAIRATIGASFAILVALLLNELSKQLFSNWPVLLFTILAGLVGAGLGDILYFHALEVTEVSVVVPIKSSTPFWIALISLSLGWDSLNMFIFLGLGTIILGITLVTRDFGSKRPLSTTVIIKGRNQKKGMIFALVSALVASIAVLMYNLASNYFTPFQANAIRLPMVGILFFLISRTSSFTRIGHRNEISKPSRNIMLILGAGGTLSLGIAGILLFAALSLIGPTRTIAITSTNPVFAAIFSAILLRESLMWQKIFGIFFVCIGLILIALF
ncbi:MAG: DMT family transporter [Candidatus Hodarchaeota archaeon]